MSIGHLQDDISETRGNFNLLRIFQTGKIIKSGAGSDSKIRLCHLSSSPEMTARDSRSIGLWLPSPGSSNPHGEYHTHDQRAPPIDVPVTNQATDVNSGTKGKRVSMRRIHPVGDQRRIQNRPQKRRKPDRYGVLNVPDRAILLTVMH